MLGYLFQPCFTAIINHNNSSFNYAMVIWCAVRNTDNLSSVKLSRRNPTDTEPQFTNLSTVLLSLFFLSLPTN